MKIRIHQIKIDFHVTPEIERYVYVYLMEGEFCYLIDSGVDGAEAVIEKYMGDIGREMSEIKAIFLTHAHPDHIGSAAKIREISGCRVYASAGESRWIRNIDLQFAERPIPNFYTLVNRSVPVDEILKDGDVVEPEEGLKIKAVGTPGHSCDELSYILFENNCIFTGDVIPVKGDIPIWIDREEQKRSLIRLKELKDIAVFYPAWDVTYEKEMAIHKIEDAILLMDELQKSVDSCKEKDKSPEDIVVKVCDIIKTPHFLKNPLFKRTIQAMM